MIHFWVRSSQWQQTFFNMYACFLLKQMHFMFLCISICILIPCVKQRFFKWLHMLHFIELRVNKLFTVQRMHQTRTQLVSHTTMFAPKYLFKLKCLHLSDFSNFNVAHECFFKLQCLHPSAFSNNDVCT